MSKAKNIIGMRSFFESVFVAIVFIVAVGVIGKTCSLAIQKYNGIQKNIPGQAANSEAQEDGNDDEDGKFSENQLNGNFASEYIHLTFSSIDLDKVAFQTYISAYTATHFLTVPTPPPNC